MPWVSESLDHKEMCEKDEKLLFCLCSPQTFNLKMFQSTEKLNDA